MGKPQKKFFLLRKKEHFFTFNFSDGGVPTAIKLEGVRGGYKKITFFAASLRFDIKEWRLLIYLIYMKEYIAVLV